VSARNTFANNVFSVASRRLRDSDGIHFDQRAGEVRAVPRACAGARRRGRIRAGEFDFRRHRPTDLSGVEGARPGAGVHRVCDRLYRGIAGRLYLLPQEQVRDVPRPRAGSSVPLMNFVRQLAVAACVVVMTVACSSTADKPAAPKSSEPPPKPELTKV